MLNWLKANRKKMNAGKMKVERVEEFRSHGLRENRNNEGEKTNQYTDKTVLYQKRTAILVYFFDRYSNNLSI